jgi:hypothetical protein
MLIPLVCNQCGGKLEVEKSQVFESGDTVIVLSDQTFKCLHCGTNYLPGEKIKHFQGNVAMFIGGVNNGNVVIGNGNIINKGLNPATHATRVNSAHQDHPIELQVETKPLKKWWQFWRM